MTAVTTRVATIATTRVKRVRRVKVKKAMRPLLVPRVVLPPSPPPTRLSKPPWKK